MDVDTFLITVYVLVDTFCQTHLPPEPHRPGPAPALSRSEVLTLAIFGQWMKFASEQDFYRYAERHLRPYFPTLPHRSQYNRLLRRHQAALAQFALYLAEQLGRGPVACDVLDVAPAPVRNAKRRGRGWLAGEANIGFSLRLGWFAGFRVLTAVSLEGVITGWGVAPASTNERSLAETLIACRAHPDPRLPSVGTPVATYLADSGFAGEDYEAHLAATYGVTLVATPQRGSRRRWPKPVRRWAARHRQIVETVIGRLLHAFGLERERPHTLAGFQARLAARVALHNLCCWLNRQRERPLLAVANLITW
jgi:hypothetical protein